MSLIKLLWCKVVGHKPSETEYSKECDGSIETYNVCKRCGRETNQTTFYDCTDFTPDDLINQSVLGNTKKGPNTPPKVVDINDVPTQFGDIEGQKNFDFFKNVLNQNKDE